MSTSADKDLMSGKREELEVAKVEKIPSDAWYEPVEDVLLVVTDGDGFSPTLRLGTPLSGQGMVLSPEEARAAWHMLGEALAWIDRAR